MIDNNGINQGHDIIQISSSPIMIKSHTDQEFIVQWEEYKTETVHHNNGQKSVQT